MHYTKYYLCFENEKQSENVNIKLNILIEIKIHDTFLAHRTYKIFKSGVEEIKSRALGNLVSH